MDPIYDRDVLDAVIAAIKSQGQRADRQRVCDRLQEWLPQRRVLDAFAMLDAAVQSGTFVYEAAGRLSLTQLGEKRIAECRFPEGIPSAIIHKRYRQEQPEYPDQTLKELFLFAILATYDVPLSMSEIRDEWERRHGLRPNLHEIVNRLIESDKLTANDENRYTLTYDGMDSYERMLDLLLPHQTLDVERRPMPLVVNDINAADGEAILASRRIPHRIKEAICFAAEQLIETLNESAGKSPEDYESPQALSSVLPGFFIEKYDSGFLRRFAGIVADVYRRLDIETPFTVRSVAEAFAMRDIMHHAKEMLAANNMSGYRPLTDRENRFLIYVDAQVFNDRVFETLFSDYGTSIHAQCAATDPKTQDLSFANWFSPFKTNESAGKSRAETQNASNGP